MDVVFMYQGKPVATARLTGGEMPRVGEDIIIPLVDQPSDDGGVVMAQGKVETINRIFKGHGAKPPFTIWPDRVHIHLAYFAKGTWKEATQ